MLCHYDSMCVLTVAGSVVHNILQAMGHWEKHTCIQFVNRTEADIDYIHFAPGSCGSVQSLWYTTEIVLTFTWWKNW